MEASKIRSEFTRQLSDTETKISIISIGPGRNEIINRY